MTKTFRELAVDTQLADALEANGITLPFPIQEATLPLALSGADLIGQARTGTGKTLAFGIPVLQRIDPSRDVTQALIIVPTRELCLQVTADLKIGERRGIRIVSVYGGVGYDEQTAALDGGAHVVVGTPGRLLDLLNKRILPLGEVTELVLDEADEMLDMGFLPDVERLIEACTGKDRHTMLFSATMPAAIVTLGRRYLNKPTFTRAEAEDRFTAPQVIQHFFLVHRMDKPRLLARILQDQDRGGVFVFVRTKHMADRLVTELSDLRTPAVAVHGDLRQTMREKNLDKFRSGKATVLVCTEVAARGLDISGVTHVVNYDCPDDDKMYLHRIGRTARAGAKGTAITFAEYNEVERLSVIRKTVGARDNEPVEVFSTSAVLSERFTLPELRPWDSEPKNMPAGEAKPAASKRATKTDRPAAKRDQTTPNSDRPARRRRAQESTKPATGTPSVDLSTPPPPPQARVTATPATTTDAPSTATNATEPAKRVRTRARVQQPVVETPKQSKRDPKTAAADKTDASDDAPALSSKPKPAPQVPTPRATHSGQAETSVTQPPQDIPADTTTQAVSDVTDSADMTEVTEVGQARSPRTRAARPTAPHNPSKTPEASSTPPSTDPLVLVRGSGVPRTARRVVVDYLP
ncbi:MAG: DEAD/DEAH box helicase [Nitriliruptoraceae bacterium]